MSIKWNLDKSHSEVQFKVKHMVISTVSGEFLDFSAHAISENEDFAKPSFEFEAKVDSVNTKNADRDGHLKGEDFFNANEFPVIKFRGNEFDGEKLKGEITLKGVTRLLTLNADFGGVITDPYGNLRAGFEFNGEINRKDFGLNWNATTDSGGLIVGDNVKLFVNLEFIKQ